MLCDDAAFMRLTLKKIVEGAGHQVIAEAENGLQAVEHYEIYRPEIVLMDITMPEMDGIEAVKKIKEINPEATIIMVSAMGQQEKVFAAIAAGARDFVVKPFESKKILDCIRKYI
jgi:two-component system chemotaxis response regulator CheY